ncbi:MAG: M20 family metallopeptidase, partial [Candidatus Lokiarchaeota archaeon]|nr:M20 family metallopeptidase [Candidatus Lokiarchaeota archaeon]
MTEESILNEIESNKEEYINFLQRLIQINTYNPPGNEKDLADKIEKYLKEVGIECEIFPFGDNRANLIASLNDNFDGPNLLYNGHMDTVPPSSLDDWKFDPLSGFIKRNKIMYGRGTTDMKSGLAGMIIALKILKKLNINLS